MKSNGNLILAFLAILLMLISFSAVVMAVSRGSEAQINCGSNRLCQIDLVWLQIQEKLGARISSANEKPWFGKVWHQGNWISMDQAYPKSVTSETAQEEQEERDASSVTSPLSDIFAWENIFQKKELRAVGIGQPTLSEAQLIATFGDCRQSSTSPCDSTTRACQENKNFVSANIKTIVFLGKNIRVHNKMAPIFKQISEEISTTVPDYRPSDVGSYFCRVIGGTTQLSSHAFGVTLDIDSPENGFYSPPDGSSCINNLLTKVVEIFKKHGFCWGGQFRNVCDAMHFEYCNPNEPPQTP